MIGRRFIAAAALLLLTMSTGCTRWWCEQNCPTPVAGCPPAAVPACGCAPGYYQPPVAVPAASASFAQPRPLTGCCPCAPQ